MTITSKDKKALMNMLDRRHRDKSNGSRQDRSPLTRALKSWHPNDCSDSKASVSQGGRPYWLHAYVEVDYQQGYRQDFYQAVSSEMAEITGAFPDIDVDVAIRALARDAYKRIYGYARRNRVTRFWERLIACAWASSDADDFLASLRSGQPYKKPQGMGEYVGIKFDDEGAPYVWKLA